MAHIVLIRFEYERVSSDTPLSREMTPMIRKFAALFALILTLGMAAAPVAAQDIDTTDMEAMGVENVYARQYEADPNATTETNPQALMAVGIVLDDADRIHDATFDVFVCAFTGGFVSELTGSDEVQNCEDLETMGMTLNSDLDMGDRALELSGDSTMPLNILAVQNDNVVFIMINIGDPAAGSLDAFGTAVADAEVSDSEVELNADGTSTGGFFDMLPQEGDEAVEGFVPAADISLLEGVETATPDSTPAN